MKWLSRTLVTSPYCYGLCTSEKDFHRELKRLNVPRKEWPEFVGAGPNSSGDATTHFFENKHDLFAIVTIKSTKGRTAQQVYALLTHEAVHIWQAIKDDLEENKPGSEFEAYAIQAITQNLTTAFSKK